MTNPISFSHALCRRPCPDLGAGQTTSPEGQPSFELALEQHAGYVALLESLGLKVSVLDAEAGYPDAHFVEDTAVVTPHVAVITRPGHENRRGEEVTIAPHLSPHRPLVHITAPGTLDGGDVLMVGNHFFVGLSERTNQEGADQLGRTLEQHGHTWQAVPVGAGLHLKSGVNEVGEILLVTEAFSKREEFREFPQIVVHVNEQYAANTLRINDHLITPEGYPRTRELLQKTGLTIHELPLSEMRKMDGGLTCLSLRF